MQLSMKSVQATSRTHSPRLHPHSATSYSSGAGGKCVECGLMEHGTLMRDSKLSEGPVVTVGTRAWCSFVAAALAKGHQAPPREDASWLPDL
ncbi:protein of unknown function [Streptomyces sp. 3214.6]|nr:protein of unknown function [Streptomyces sp. 3214.6]